MNIWIRVSYSVLMLITVAIAFVVLRKNQRRLPLSPDQRLSLAISAFVGTMIGAKLPFLTQLGLEGVTTGTIWFADGKTILGGIFGGYLTIEVAKSIQGIRVSTGDSFALPVAIAVFMGRIGCFIGGCCFGTVTDLPWGVHFPLSGDSPEMLRHPTQLYEAAFHLIGILVLILAQRNNWWPNQKLKVYLLAYLVYRFLSEWIRPEADVFLGLTLYQFVSIGLAICLTMLWVRDERYRVSEQNQLSPAQSSGSG